MNYWIDLFTCETWEEFLHHGSNVSGFRETQMGQSNRVKAGDVFLCYLTGVQRWSGALEVLGRSDNKDVIWKSDTFPARFDVQPVVELSAEQALPMASLAGKTSFYASAQDKGKYKGLVRRSLTGISSTDGTVIMELLMEVEAHPITRPIDPRLRTSRSYPTTKSAPVGGPDTPAKSGGKMVRSSITVPDSEPIAEANPEPKEVRQHTEVQGILAALGADMGMHVWIAKNDRSQVFNGKPLGDLPMVVASLPTQFSDLTTRTIELIDVLWLKGNAILAAFEVECTTSVHSGILRMSDLLALQPNLEIQLFLVAPEERRAKVQTEILRPTFTLRDKPIPKMCGFLAIGKLKTQLSQLRQVGIIKQLNPRFLTELAEYFEE